MMVYIFRPPCLSLVLISLLGLGNLANSRPLCRYDQYKVKDSSGKFIRCRDCPRCSHGTGLNIECPWEINPGTVTKCVDCAEGSTFSDNDEPDIVICRSCNIKIHRVVVKHCNKTQNTVYADECKAGYYFDEDCKACTCCPKNKLQQTCSEVGEGVPPNTTCQCPLTIVEPYNNTSVQNNTTVRPSEDPVGPSREKPSEKGNGFQQDVNAIRDVKPDGGGWIGAVLFLPIFCVTISIGIARHCWNERGGMKAFAKKFHHCSIACVPQDVLDCPLSEVDFLLRSHVAKKLDVAVVEPRRLAGWYEVGRKFDISRDDLKGLKLRYLKLGSESPTEGLFDILEARGKHEPPLKEFLNILISLKRKDIISGWDWHKSKPVEQS